MDKVKFAIVYWFFTHIFLRRIGKRYPDFFKRWVYETTDNRIERRVMLARYTGDEQIKFEAIAIKLKIDISNLFKYHKRAVESMIAGKI